MAPEWKVYCLRHRELFDAGKLAALGDLVRPSKAGEFPPDAVERMGALIARKEGELGPDEGACVDRILALVRAFVARHRDCDLRVASRDSGEYLRVVAREGQAWLGFSIWEDRAYWATYWGGGFRATLEAHEAHAARCRAEIERLRRAVADERSDILRRRKLEQSLERWRAGLGMSMEMMDEIAVTAKRNRGREFGVDVLEEMRTIPFKVA
jgi:hypothetical protein